ncbi:MAG: class I SAM-dependent methyltransferase [Egibacteraceae bacterium]
MPDLPDYKQDPEAYELEERSRPDEMLMINTAVAWALSLLDDLEKAFVLDLCCGTGLSLDSIVDHPNIGLIVGVDICKPYLDFAAKRFSGSRTEPIYLQEDAVEVCLPEYEWDVVMLCSAYHHIENERKLQFLEKVRRLIGASGHAVLAENVLPQYEEHDEASYENAIRFFYAEVLKEAKSKNPELPSYVEGLIERVAQYGYDGDYEYKTCYRVLANNLENAGLRIVLQERVWPRSGALSRTSGGNYVLLLRAAS